MDDYVPSPCGDVPALYTDVPALCTDGLSGARAPERTVTAREMIERLQQSSPTVAQDAIDALLELVELDDPVRDGGAILAVRVSEPTSNAGVTRRGGRGSVDPLDGQRRALAVRGPRHACRWGRLSDKEAHP